jgi:DNA-binding NtrC family response regulator
MKSVNVLSVGLSDLVSTRNASLRRAGFQVVAAASFAEAREACGSQAFDVVVVGQTLSSEEKVRLLRRFTRGARIPLVLITGRPFLTCDRADSYISSDAPIKVLCDAIAQLSADGQVLKAHSATA